MSYEDTIKIMLSQGLIKKQKVDFSHIEALLLRAQKDVVAARANLEIDEEVTYTYAYLAMLRCGRAIVFIKGFRSVDGNSIKQLSNYLEKYWEKNLRVLLKSLIACVGNEINLLMIPLFLFQKIEAKNALIVAQNFIKIVQEIIKKENPQLGLRL